MRNLIIILTIFLSTFGYSQETQEDFKDYIGSELSKLEYDVEFQSTYKTGDNDSFLRGALENIFTDRISKYRYFENFEFHFMSVSNSSLTTIIPFTEWVESISIDLYPSSEYHFKYINYENSESISVYDIDDNVYNVSKK